MKHTSKRLLSILLCLVLMLSLVPAAYADDLTNDDCLALISAMKNLLTKMKAENKDTDDLKRNLNMLDEAFALFLDDPVYHGSLIKAYEKAKEVYDKYNTSDDGGDGINLYPVVLQANSLYNRYGEFYGKSVISGLVNGFSAAFPKLVGNVDWSDFKTAWGKLETDNPFPVLSGLNPSIAKVWNTIGQNFVGTENSTAGDGSVVGAIAALEAGITLPSFS